MKQILLSRNQILALYLVGLTLVLLFPLPLPLAISADVRAMYNYVDKLPAGSVVYVNVGGRDWYDGLTFPPFVAVLNHLFKIKAKMIFITLGSQGRGGYAEYVMSLLNPAAGIVRTYDAKYGADYVIFPAVAGMESGMIAWFRDIWATTPNDYFQTPISQLPMMTNIKSARDLNFGVTFGTLITNQQADVRQLVNIYGTKIMMITSDTFAAGLRPYVSSGQCIGILYGARSGAEYEMLVGKPGQGLASMGQYDVMVGIYVVTILIAIITGINTVSAKKIGKVT